MRQAHRLFLVAIVFALLVGMTGCRCGGEYGMDFSGLATLPVDQR